MNDERNDLVSVIVPIYKVEEYLRECVDSIINQTYKNLEIILVDDGSPDKCGEICDEYARNDSRITVYHKENGGVSDTRNYAMARSHGEYIVFVDSDDVMKSTFVETLMDILKKYEADIVFSSYIASSDSATLHKIETLNDYEIHTDCVDADEALRRMLYQDDNFNAGPHRKIYRRKVMEGIEYPKGINVAEDLATNCRILLQCRKAAFTTEKLYGYRIRRDSLIRTSDSYKMTACLTVTRQIYGDICAQRPALRLAAASRAFSVNRATYFNIPYRLKEERMKIWEEMKKYRREVLFDPHARKRERLAALVSYLGPGFFHMFSRLYRRYLMRERG